MADVRYVVGAKKDTVSNPHDAVKALDKDVEILGEASSRYIIVVTTPEKMGRITQGLGQDYIVEGEIRHYPLSAPSARL